MIIFFLWKLGLFRLYIDILTETCYCITLIVVHYNYINKGRKPMKVLVASSLALVLFLVLAANINTSVLIGLMLTSSMIFCILAALFLSKKSPSRPENYRLKKPAPVVRFELRFILFLVGDHGLYYLPNGQQIEGHDIDLYSKVRQCFLSNPDYFVQEREAERLLRSENEMPAALPGNFKIQLNFKFHYQPEMSATREMISPFELEPGKQFRTTDFKRLISSVQSVLKSKPELIGQEMKLGRLTPVTPHIEKNH